MNIAVRAAIGVAAAVLALMAIVTAAVTAIFNQFTGAGLLEGLFGPSAVSATARSDIPPRMLALYQRAAPTCPGLDWSVLAAIGKVETDHGRHPTMVSSAGAVGPMQFLPSTFVLYAHPIPPGGKKPPTPWDPTDAVYAAARLLCANGARHGKDLYRAIYAYNHADWYVRKVRAQAKKYATTPTLPAGRPALKAIAYARAQIGLPYIWGGNGPAAGHAGFDCSGLTQAAYRAAGIRLPRVAEAQYHATPKVPRGQRLRPGDLVFYGRPGNIHHVGLYIGNGKMIDAPYTGARVRIEPYRKNDYWGATRPVRLSGR
ncbi:bifunctional lytic transglycosylase/C40 family peptidase [Streptomyces sp. NPDC050315]|uniref:bifunctional lytic transglycosylase/C40 family peptidase n=1 Tax=Streptomyces sp. NPDC050315 TaxID=3155039 RepID=UPI003447041C